MNRLGNYVNSVIDNRGKNPEYYSEGKEHPILDNFLINGNKYPSLNSVKRFIDENIYNSFIRKYAKKDDVAITLVGNGCGNCCLVPSDDWVIIQNTIGLQLKDSLNSHFLYYYLKLHKPRVVQLDGGSSQPNIRMDNFLNLEVDFPKIKTQVNTAKVLSDLDAKIELNNKINAELEAMAKLIYDYWFVQFDFTDENGRPYKSLGGKMVYNQELKREIPEGWEVGELGFWIDSDKSGDWGKEKSEGNYTEKVSCVRGADINGLNGQGKVKAPKRYILNKNSHKILEAGDLIIEISGGSPTQSTGRLGYIIDSTLERFENPLICSNFCRAITLTDKKYIYNFIQLWNRLYNAGVLFGWEGKTSGIKNLLFDSFISNYSQPIPEYKLVEKYYDKVDPIYNKIQQNLKENERLAELRDWLLPMLMNGQVTVK